MTECNYAIVLSAGSGKRMGTDVPKQYMNIEGYPVIYYSLKAFEDSAHVDRIILVTRKEDLDYCQKEIVERYGFSKVCAVISGGSERYESVYKGLCAVDGCCRLVFIHDGARPCIDDQLIAHLSEDACVYGNAVAAVRSKDTVRISDDNGVCIETPKRSNVWNIQTPQVFFYGAVKAAYDKMIAAVPDGITDDAMVMEQFSDEQIHLTEASYSNIKVTTVEDILPVTKFLKKTEKTC